MNHVSRFILSFEKAFHRSPTEYRREFRPADAGMPLQVMPFMMIMSPVQVAVMSYVFRENRVLTFLGALAGMPLGILLHRFVMSQIKVDMVSFIPHISALTYVFALAMTFLFESVVHLVMRRRIARIPMAESLKSVE